MAAVGFGWMALAASSEPEFWTYLLPTFVIAGVGSMMIGTTVSAAAFVDLDDSVLGRAAGSYYVTRRLGSAAGAIAAVAILGEQIGDAAVTRFQWIWIFSATCFLVSSATMYYGFHPRSSDRQPNVGR